MKVVCIAGKWYVTTAGPFYTREAAIRALAILTR